MGRLAELIEGEASRDIVVRTQVGLSREAEDPERRKEAESGSVRQTIDLRYLRRFGREHWMAADSSRMIVVKRDGEIRIGSRLAERLGDSVAFYLSKNGTILVVRDEPDEVPVAPAEAKSKAKRATLRALANALVEAGVSLPARFSAEWDSELNAWVGRRILDSR